LISASQSAGTTQRGGSAGTPINFAKVKGV
jgi:hypothetical protein